MFGRTYWLSDKVGRHSKETEKRRPWKQELVHLSYVSLSLFEGNWFVGVLIFRQMEIRRLKLLGVL